VLLAGCDPHLPGKPDPANRPVPAERVVQFDTLYGRNCAGCHGGDGHGGPAPPLNDPLFRALVPAAELEKVLQEGRSGTPMPPFAHAGGGPLTAIQVQVLVHEIKGIPYRIDGGKTLVADPKGITPRWGIPPAAPVTAPPYLLPEASGNEAQGAKLFTRACASCHGEQGAGVSLAGQLRNRINEPAFLALVSNQALRRIMITGRHDLNMPSYAESQGRGKDFAPLTSTDLADLNALLSSWRAGKTDK
jgi:cytochrome c oxidase cbb3-type subunit 3/ubiquinol-cytochrome c reductase cytochrome c subunit